MRVVFILLALGLCSFAMGRSLPDSIKISAPRVTISSDLFVDKTVVGLELRLEGVSFFYTTDGTTPNTGSNKYEHEVQIDQSCVFKVIAYKKGWKSSDVVEVPLIKISRIPKKINLKNLPADQYSGSGANGLIDLHRGSINFQDGKWLGFHGSDLQATIDMGSAGKVRTLSLSFLVNTGAYIFGPKSVSVMVSKDGKSWSKSIVEAIEVPKSDEIPSLKEIQLQIPKKMVRYLKIEASSIGFCPEWHPGAGEKAWLFIDEIIIK